jgi:hypothetical protein
MQRSIYALSASAAFALATVSYLGAPAQAGTSVASPTIRAMANGSYLTSYADGEQVYSTGPVSRTSHSTGAGKSGSSFAPAAVGKNTALAAAAPASTPSSVEMLAAMGAPASVQAKFAHFDDLGTTSTTSSVRPMASGTAAIWTGQQLYDRICDGDSNLDGGHLSTWGCWNQWLVWTDGLHWKFMDKWYMSASHNGGSNSLTGLQMSESYTSGNHWLDWQPKRSISTGTCYTQSVGLSFVGVSTSTSWEVCPAESGLFYIRGDSYPILIRTKWDGNHNGPVNGSRDSTGLAKVDNSASASAQRGWGWQVWWQ